MSTSGVRNAAGISLCISTALAFAGWATSAEAAHPHVAPVLYGLAVLAALGAGVLMLMPVRPRAATVADWREQETRFRQLNKNIGGHWDHRAGTRLLEWSL